MALVKAGLYIGKNSVAGVVLEGRRIIAKAKFDLSSLEEEAAVESLDENVRWEALINKVLREIGLKQGAVNVSLTDSEFIFRSFEMPLLNKQEMSSAIPFEVGKYIPFKLEELLWDWGSQKLARTKKTFVSFIGVREHSFNKYFELLKNLQLKPYVGEPSSLSLSRVLKTNKKYSSLKNFSLIDLSAQEGSITFFFLDLPIFNRSFSISYKDGALDIENLGEHLRISFQYFRREFKEYNIDRVVILNDTFPGDMETAVGDIVGVPVSVISPRELLDGEDILLEHLKAAGVAGRDYYPYKFKPVFQKIIPEAGIEIGERVVPLRLGLLSVLFFVGVVGMVFVSIYLGNEEEIKKIELGKKEEKIEIPVELKEFSWKKRKTLLDEKTKQLKEYKDISSSIKKISPFLEKLPFYLPQGLWLDSLSLRLYEGGYEGTISGYAFLGNAFEERRKIDEFLNTLRKSVELQRISQRVDPVSSEQKILENFPVTAFTIKISP